VVSDFFFEALRLGFASADSVLAALASAFGFFSLPSSVDKRLRP